jgi:hypothetical protein
MNLYTLLATLSSNNKIVGIQKTCERIERYAQHKQKPSTRKVSLSHVKKPHDKPKKGAKTKPSM